MSGLPDLGFTLSATTERAYLRLPAFYRAADAVRDYPLLRYMALTYDQAGGVEALLDRVTDLADPQRMDPEWRFWLAQLVGTSVTPDMTETEWRDALTYASAGWRAGTKTAVADAAKSALTGERYARVYDHATSVLTRGQDTEWDVLIVTRESETPDVSAVLEAVSTQRAKPAGVILHHEAYNATWATLATQRPTWADWNGVEWRDIEETV